MVRRRECRSHCPINYGLEVFGDPWSLLVLRDAVFFGKRTFREFLASPERIASNILADRLRRLAEAGILRRTGAAKRPAYRPTAKGLDLLPVLLEMIAWGARHDPKTAAPPEFIRRLKRDREGLMREVRAAVRTAGAVRRRGR